MRCLFGDCGPAREPTATIQATANGIAMAISHIEITAHSRGKGRTAAALAYRFGARTAPVAGLADSA